MEAPGHEARGGSQLQGEGDSSLGVGDPGPVFARCSPPACSSPRNSGSH